MGAVLLVLFIQLFSARAGSRTAHLPDGQQVGGLEATGDSDFAVPLSKGLVAADSDVGSDVSAKSGHVEEDCFHFLEQRAPETFFSPSSMLLCDPTDLQAPLSMGFPRQEYGVGCRFLLQEIFPTQGSCVSCIGR